MDGDIEPVVVDLGTWMCKAGYAGDKTAQAYERTLVAKAQPDQLCFGTAALQSGEEHELSCPMSRGAVTDWEHMERFLNYVFSKELRSGIADCSMLVTEVPNNEQSNRHSLVELMFEKFNIPALYLAIPACLALYSSGRLTGAVLDIGGSVTHAVAIKNGKICSTFDDANNTTAMQRINVGGHDVTETLARTVDARCGTSYSSSLRRLLQMEYLKERVCIYGESTQHTLPDGTAVEVDEEIRNICAMSHYHCQGIKSILYDVISACDHDVRPELLKNVIVSGGASMPLGVVDTITSSLRRSVTSGTGITVVAPPERKKSTWLGGSVLASLSTFPEFCKSRRDYQEHGVSYFDSFCDGEILDKHVDT
ncbi:uncharacterized protein LOC128202738 isoform X2 [Mya arenaria]|uniref:uncharacterized protein LOC128202738 isoform X2 n=1 Tax=Mya arenaria TaxID=6604 RepID=UPI0022E97E96|nr:uncharacterized protein LOC128202738 isoform X2 [Mya arenaria]